MKIRLVCLLVVIGAALGWFHLEQQKGRFVPANQWFLDMLVANTRDAFLEKMPAQSPEVVLVEFHEEEKAEFSAWPPAPLDYITVLKKLAEHEPSVLGMAEVLTWDVGDMPFQSQLREAMLPFDSVVLGYRLSAEKNQSPDQTMNLDDMPVLPPSDGNASRATPFQSLTALPSPALRIAGQLGFVSIDEMTDSKEETLLPFAASDGAHLLPSFAAQVVTAYRRAPFASQRLRFGTGARLSLGDKHVVPLEADGALQLLPKPTIAKLDALDLMIPEVDEDISKILGQGKVVILTNTPPQGKSAGELQAQAIAQALAMPELTRANPMSDWIMAGAAFLFALWQLRYGRFRALLFGVLSVVVGMVVCLLVFQASLVWWSPLPALAVVLASTLFCFLWPHRSKLLPSAETPAEVA
jgi:hypothetical protein